MVIKASLGALTIETFGVCILAVSASREADVIDCRSIPSRMIAPVAADDGRLLALLDDDAKSWRG